MKNLKNILFAAMTLLTLNTTFASTSISNELGVTYCSENGHFLILEIPDLDLRADIQLLRSTYEAPVTVRLSANGLTVEVVIDGNSALISGDGINPRIDGDGINPLISGDGINVRIDGDGINPLISGDGINPRIDGDGINPLISGDGINPSVNVTVQQLGAVLFSDQL